MKGRLLEEIQRAVASHPGRTSWREPLMACADAHDPLFGRLGEVANPGHLQPSDILRGARTVIAYFLPFSRGIIAGNSSGRYASDGWARSYIETNALIAHINTRMSAVLESHDFRAGTIAPTHNFDVQSLLSPWSHRHAAYNAGLGTFGLNRMLITEQGCCGRIGSLVTDAAIPADPRPEQEYCPFRIDGSCGACVKRCPVGALSTSAFDRHACYGALLANERRFAHLGRADVCGKCLCGLPCSEARPS